MVAELETRAFETDEGQATRAAIGLVVLQTDETIEHDFRAMLPTDGVRCYVNRISSHADVTEATLRSMEGDLPVAAALLPQAVSFDAIGYGCTSASLIIGEEKVAARLTADRPGVPTSNPYSALAAACRALGVKRLAIVSPYLHEISATLRDGLESTGIQVPRIVSFGVGEERVVARIAPGSILDALADAGGGSDCDAVFASCTNLRAAEMISTAESRLDKPVLCSNQVLVWHLMRLAGLDDGVTGFGRLFDCGAGDP